MDAGELHRDHPRGGVALWAWSPSRRLAQFDSLCRSFWKTSKSVVPIDDLFAKVHPEDRHGMMLNWDASATEPQPYSFDFRVGEGPDTRWISTRGVGGDVGQFGEWVQARSASECRPSSSTSPTASAPRRPSTS
jgi:hypothetical protein